MTGREVEQFEIPADRPLVVEFAPGGGFLRRDYLDNPFTALPNQATG